MNTQAIASHLNIIDSAIIEIQEWANVLWVKFIGGVRFVSKKIGAKVVELEKHNLTVHGLNPWTPGKKFKNLDRVLEIVEVTGETPMYEIEGVTHEGYPDSYADREWVVQHVTAKFVKNV
jgi:hypothetical protein